MMMTVMILASSIHMIRMNTTASTSFDHKHSIIFHIAQVIPVGMGLMIGMVLTILMILRKITTRGYTRLTIAVMTVSDTLLISTTIRMTSLLAKGARPLRLI